MRTLCAALLIILALGLPGFATGTLDVYFIDVGQGDAILIDYGEYEMLIDGGSDGSCVPFLAQYVDGSLEVLVVTHPHSDHVGGLDDVLRAFVVDKIVTNGARADTNAFRNFDAAAAAEGCPQIVANRNVPITLDDLTFRILHPDQLTGDANEDSIVLSLTYGQIDFLFTGDIENETEAELLKTGCVPDIDVLKVAHHGSRYSSTEDFLDATQPELAVYSAGVGNRYGHPAQETLARLTASGATVLGTDRCGTVHVGTDGASYVVFSGSLKTEFRSQAAPENSSYSPAQSTIVITKIHYDGAVARAESDEYVEISNVGPNPQDIVNWRLVDISDGYPEFQFPSCMLYPGQSIRVYTDEVHPEWGGFSYRSGRAVWNDTEPDTAVLYDAEGREVSRKSYEPDSN